MSARLPGGGNWRHVDIVFILVDAAADAGLDEVPEDWWPEGFEVDAPERCGCADHAQAGAK